MPVKFLNKERLMTMNELTFQMSHYPHDGKIAQKWDFIGCNQGWSYITPAVALVKGNVFKASSTCQHVGTSKYCNDVDCCIDRILEGAVLYKRKWDEAFSLIKTRQIALGVTHEHSSHIREKLFDRIEAQGVLILDLMEGEDTDDLCQWLRENIVRCLARIEGELHQVFESPGWAYKAITNASYLSYHSQRASDAEAFLDRIREKTRRQIHIIRGQMIEEAYINGAE